MRLAPRLLGTATALPAAPSPGLQISLRCTAAARKRSELWSVKNWDTRKENPKPAPEVQFGPRVEPPSPSPVAFARGLPNARAHTSTEPHQRNFPQTGALRHLHMLGEGQRAVPVLGRSVRHLFQNIHPGLATTHSLKRSRTLHPGFDCLPG